MMDLSFINLILHGIFLGGIFACLGYGVFMWKGVMGIINAAHGDFAVLASYICFLLLEFYGVDPLLALPLVIILMFTLGFVIQKYMINRFLPGNITRILLITFALSVITQNSLQILFTVNERSLYVSYYRRSITLGYLNIPLVYLLSFTIAIITFIILYLFLTRTLLGKAMRAIPKDIEAAKMLGINPANIYNYSMGISVALAGIAGVILGLLYQFDPFTGVSYMVISLGVVIIGGLGSIKGTIVGGIATGLAYVLGGYFLGPLFQYVVCYLLILIALIIKPTGLFGGG